MHPYSAAKMVASFAYLHGRRVFLNLVAGGFKNDLDALGDATPHDRRYDRLIEYMTVVQGLLRSSHETGAALSFRGDFYQVERLKLTPAAPASFWPGVLLSGSSDAGLAAARTLGAVAVQYPRHPGAYEAPLAAGMEYGVRVGVITRRDGEEAWRIARERFPADRRGQIAHQLAMKVSDSAWHKQLSDLGSTAVPDSPYWLHPFENYKTFCPYLVGSYERVGEEIRRYAALGYRTFILDIPTAEAEFAHTAEAFELAARAIES
jgi:alkanesulfonate monooxygenase